ncbi:hypothetical protein FS837_007688, partial [Tulasnella sp. UAMH 9824]
HTYGASQLIYIKVNRYPIGAMDETVAQDTVTDPDSDSLVQPGRLVSGNQFLPELLGTLIRGRDEANSGGQYAIFACARGVWEQPDRSVTDVFIKRFKDSEGDYRIDKQRFNTVGIIKSQLEC